MTSSPKSCGLSFPSSSSVHLADDVNYGVGVQPVIMNWPERIKTQPHDDRDNCFLPFDSKGPCGMTVNNDIDDDSATKHGDSHTRNSHSQSV